ARLANDQGREVMAVPGPPGDPRASGPNALIKQGAHLIENAQDVLRVIQPLRHQPLREPPGLAFRREFKALKDHPVHSQDAADALSQARETLHGLLGGGPVTVDEILRQCQLSAAQGAILLLELELAGRLERLPGNMIQPIR
ncbi:MAG: DNA-protecting protein DprA, partial [Rhodospirillaceae bacterium]